MLNVLALILAIAIPPSSSRVVDDAELLAPEDEQMLSDSFAKIRSETGVHLGVLTISNLDESPKSVAVRTINDWQMTRKSILLLVSTNPRKIWIQPGSEYANGLDERTASAIARDIVAPRLRAGESFLGIVQGLEAASAAILNIDPQRPTAPTQQVEESPKKSYTGWLILGGGLLFLGVLFLIVRRYERKRQEAEDEFQNEYTYVNRPSRAVGVAPSSPTGYSGSRVSRAPVAPTTIVNNGGGGSDLLTGVLIGNAISGHHHHTPAPAYTPPPAPSYTPTRTYDDSPSYGGGSSWDSGSSGGGFDSGGGGGGGSDW